jgi:hypothetical protein
MNDASTTATLEAAPPAARNAHPPRARRSNLRFGITIAILLISAVSMQTAANRLGQYFRKEAVPLRKSLAALDRNRLGPEYTLHAVPPATIPDEVIESLGTEEFANLRLVDLSKERGDPTSVAHLFVTYYTGKPDMVPHVPDECYQAGGYDPLGAQSAELHVPGVGAEGDRIPVRVLAFGLRGEGLLATAPKAEQQRMYVMYFFNTNGAYVTTRNQVRLKTASLFDKYAYYAKIEGRFTDYSMQRTAGEQESVAAMEKLMRKVMPILLEEHFADWAKLKEES